MPHNLADVSFFVLLAVGEKGGGVRAGDGSPFFFMAIKTGGMVSEEAGRVETPRGFPVGRRGGI